MMEKLTVSVIGCGNMGSAIVRGMTGDGRGEKYHILLFDKEIDKTSAFDGSANVEKVGLLDAVRKADILIIAVKPQDSGRLFKDISGENITGAIVSVMAGVSTGRIIEMLGKNVPVVRAMPNMAAFVGESVTCISRNELVGNMDDVKDIFTGIGEIVEVKEDLMDAVTALSGSGPAYLFYLADAMVEAGIEVGLHRDVAIKLTGQTLYGSSALMRQHTAAPGDLIKTVVSKGGTTEAALSVFDENKVKDIIKYAIKKAKERSEELAKG